MAEPDGPPIQSDIALNTSRLHASGRRPPSNVLYLLFDDLRADLGAGNAKARGYTQHLDTLAESGVSFELAFSQVAFCVPSRASFLTGMRPESTRSVHNDQVLRFGSDRLKPLKPGHTVVDVFKRAGYTTAAVGKIFHFGEQHPSLDLPVLPQTHDLLGRPCDQRPDAKDVRVPQALARFGFPKACSLPFGAFVDERIAAGAVGYLRKLAADRPFLLMVGFMRPHNPYQFPSRFLDRVPGANETDVSGPRWRHPSQPAIAYADGTDCTQRKCMREQRRYYRAAVAHADEMAGHVLRELGKLRVVDTTLVVAHSDHGFSLGEGGAWQKRTNFDHSTRVPLLLRVPHMPKTAGLRVSHAPVELVDVVPTLLDLSGAGRVAPAPPHLQGRSLRPLLVRGGSGRHQFTHAFMLQPRLLYLSRNASSRRAARQSSNPLLGLIVDGGGNVSEVLDGGTASGGSTMLRPKDCSSELVAGGFGPGRSCRFVAMGFSVRSRHWRYTRWERWPPVGSNTSRIWTVGEGQVLAEELYCYGCNVSISNSRRGDATSMTEQINLIARLSALRLTAAQRATVRSTRDSLEQALITRRG